MICPFCNEKLSILENSSFKEFRCKNEKCWYDKSYKRSRCHLRINEDGGIFNYIFIANIYNKDYLLFSMLDRTTLELVDDSRKYYQLIFKINQFTKIILNKDRIDNKIKGFLNLSLFK